MPLKQTVSNSRKLQVQYLALVGNDSRSSLRRPSYSLFIRASLANPLFPCSCPIGILGNLSRISKWSPTRGKIYSHWSKCSRWRPEVVTSYPVSLSPVHEWRLGYLVYSYYCLILIVCEVRTVLEVTDPIFFHSSKKTGHS